MSVYLFYMKDCYGDDYHLPVNAATYDAALSYAQRCDDDATVGHLISIDGVAYSNEPHPDDLAVDRFAAAMKEKMKRSRDIGRGGWDDPEVCKIEDLGKMLVDHVAKGDPVDIANFCMMLHQRSVGRSDAVYTIRGAWLDGMNRHHEALEVFRKIEEAGARGAWTVENALKMYKDVPPVVLDDFNKGLK